MAQGLGLEWNEKPRVRDTDEKKTSVKATRKNVEGRAMGSRRIFAPHFKLKVLDSYRQDSDCRGNQRATARKYGIHRRQIQKWLQVEASLRTTVELGPASEPAALNLRGAARLLDDIASAATAAAGESQAPSQRGSNSNLASCVRNHQAPIHSVPTAHVDDAIRPATDNQEVKKEVTVSLFPSVKIEQLEIKSQLNLHTAVKNDSNFSVTLQPKRVSIELFPSVKVEATNETQDMELNIDDLKEEPMSDDDEMMVPSEPEQALDFTCAALSKRRSFSLQFKLEVLDAFHTDRQCHGNQRATARKYGINRRQVQKWLLQEVELRGETTSRGGLYRQRLGRWMDMGDTRLPEENQRPNTPVEFKYRPTSFHDDPSSGNGWDLSNRKRKAEPTTNMAPYKKRSLELLKLQNDDCEDVTSSGENDLPEVQETALCLVKVKRVPKEQNRVEDTSILSHGEVSSSADLNRVVGQALYHSNRDHIIPPYIPLPLPPHNFYCFPHQGLHHMLSHYRGFVIHR